MKSKALVLLVICLLIFACIRNCNKEMDKIRAQHGPPEEVNTYDSSDYHSVDWWYWSKGINYTFTWGSLIEEGCDVSRYTFDPITMDSAKEIKDAIKDRK